MYCTAIIILHEMIDRIYEERNAVTCHIYSRRQKKLDTSLNLFGNKAGIH